MTRTERILVCCGTGCIANGAYEVAKALEEQMRHRERMPR